MDILETLIFINKKNRFIKQSVPEEINYSVVYDIEVFSQNNGCSSKILFGGNQKKSNHNLENMMPQWDGWLRPQQKEIQLGSNNLFL